MIHKSPPSKTSCTVLNQCTKKYSKKGAKRISKNANQLEPRNYGLTISQSLWMYCKFFFFDGEQEELSFFIISRGKTVQWQEPGKGKEKRAKNNRNKTNYSL
jgi:hypothetical protein